LNIETAETVFKVFDLVDDVDFRRKLLKIRAVYDTEFIVLHKIDDQYGCNGFDYFWNQIKD
jgi:hypothetical protein